MLAGTGSNSHTGEHFTFWPESRKDKASRQAESTPQSRGSKLSRENAL